MKDKQSDKTYTDMTPEEARAMLERWNQTDIGAFLKAVKAGMPTLSFEDAVPLMEAQARSFAAAREKAESEGGVA